MCSRQLQQGMQPLYWTCSSQGWDTSHAHALSEEPKQKLLQRSCLTGSRCRSRQPRGTLYMALCNFHLVEHGHNTKLMHASRGRVWMELYLQARRVLLFVSMPLSCHHAQLFDQDWTNCCRAAIGPVTVVKTRNVNSRPVSSENLWSKLFRCLQLRGGCRRHCGCRSRSIVDYRLYV